MKLTWEDVDLDQREITVKASNAKTERSRRIGMTQRVYKALKKLRGAGQRVFPSGNPRTAFATALRLAGIDNLKFHDLRHTAATRMIRAGVSHTEVMKITGHLTMKTFMRYINLTSDSATEAANRLDKFNSQK